MVGEFRKCRIFSGFLYGISMMLTLLVNLSDSRPEADVLNQSQTLVNEMHQKAKELFNESIMDHELSVKDCKKQLNWFPKPNISRLHSTQLLKAMNENLLKFIKAFEVLLKRHTDELMHSSKLSEAKYNIDALRSNIMYLLKKDKDTLETELQVPNNQNLFDEKEECCRLINIYSDFLKQVCKGLVKLRKERYGISKPPTSMHTESATEIITSQPLTDRSLLERDIWLKPNVSCPWLSVVCTELKTNTVIKDRTNAELVAIIQKETITCNFSSKEVRLKSLQQEELNDKSLAGYTLTKRSA